jgi:hypothetical protein
VVITLEELATVRDDDARTLVEATAANARVAFPGLR